MADEQVSKSGVFIDTKTGKVVTSPPEEGVQLVPAGGTISNTRQAAIEAANTASERPAVEPSLDSMTKAELQEEADRRGVDVPAGATKADLLEALGG